MKTLEQVLKYLQENPGAPVVWLDIDDTVLDGKGQIINEEQLADSLKGKVIGFATDKASTKDLPDAIVAFINKYDLITSPELIGSSAIKTDLWTPVLDDLKNVDIVNFVGTQAYSVASFKEAFALCYYKRSGKDMDDPSVQITNHVQTVNQICSFLIHEMVVKNRVESLGVIVKFIESLDSIQNIKQEVMSSIYSCLFDDFISLINHGKLDDSHEIFNIMIAMQRNSVLKSDSVDLLPKTLLDSITSPQFVVSQELTDMAFARSAQFFELKLRAMLLNHADPENLQALIQWYRNKISAYALTSPNVRNQLETWMNQHHQLYRSLERLNKVFPVLESITADFPAQVSDAFLSLTRLVPNTDEASSSQAARPGMAVTWARTPEAHTTSVEDYCVGLSSNSSLGLDNSALRSFTHDVFTKASQGLPSTVRTTYTLPSLASSSSVSHAGSDPRYANLRVRITDYQSSEDGSIRCTFCYESTDGQVVVSYRRRFDNFLALNQFVASNKALQLLYLMYQTRTLPAIVLGTELAHEGQYIGRMGSVTTSASSSSSSSNAAPTVDALPQHPMFFCDDKESFVQNGRDLGLITAQAYTPDVIPGLIRKLGFLIEDLRTLSSGASPLELHVITEIAQRWPEPLMSS